MAHRVESILETESRQQLTSDLAHSLQVWLLGLWILNSGQDDQSLMKIVSHNIREFIKKGAENETRLPDQNIVDSLAQLKFNPDKDTLALYWGLISALHDVAVPIQRFGKWCREFFEHYFGPGSLPTDGWELRDALDIFAHPHFPIYKNAITGLHEPRQRDWLDVVFCQQFAKQFNHAIAGSLILVKELAPSLDDKQVPEPEDEPTSPAWKRLCLTISRMKDELTPERSLFLPAYFGHAIALSHLQELKHNWSLSHGDSYTQEDSYFGRTAQKFCVSFEEFPMTYLLALFEVLTAYRTTDYHPGIHTISRSNFVQSVSPFYINDVEYVTHGTTKTIRLTLTLWEEDYNIESRILRGTSHDFVRLLSHYKDLMKRKRDLTTLRFYVLNRDEFESLYNHAINEIEGPHNPLPNEAVYNCLGYKVQYNPRSGQLLNNGCYLSPKSNKWPLFCHTGAFHVIRMRTSLENFDKEYKCKACSFEIKFANIKPDGFPIIVGARSGGKGYRKRKGKS